MTVEKLHLFPSDASTGAFEIVNTEMKIGIGEIGSAVLQQK